MLRPVAFLVAAFLAAASVLAGSVALPSPAAAATACPGDYPTAWTTPADAPGAEYLDQVQVCQSRTGVFRVANQSAVAWTLSYPAPAAASFDLVPLSATASAFHTIVEEQQLVAFNFVLPGEAAVIRSPQGITWTLSTELSLEWLVFGEMVKRIKSAGYTSINKAVASTLSRPARYNALSSCTAATWQTVAAYSSAENSSGRELFGLAMSQVTAGSQCYVDWSAATKASGRAPFPAWKKVAKIGSGTAAYSKLDDAASLLAKACAALRYC